MPSEIEKKVNWFRNAKRWNEINTVLLLISFTYF